jgi:hypothetical protein
VNDRLDELVRHPHIWRAAGGPVDAETVPTGFRRLDERLPGGGWPGATLIELLSPGPGIGELQLLVPALRALTAPERRPARWVAWLSPPHVPYAPALASAGLEPARMLIVRPRTGLDVLWAMEQALRSGACAAVLGWVGAVDGNALRRLKLAAEEGASLGVLFRPPGCRAESSPAALRILLEPRAGGGLDLEILKSRGGAPSRIAGLFGP